MALASSLQEGKQQGVVDSVEPTYSDLPLVTIIKALRDYLWL